MLLKANVYLCLSSNHGNGLEVCSLNVSDLRSLDFIVNRFFTKLFNTNVTDTVKLCQDYFDFDVFFIVIEKRRKTFVAQYASYCY